MEKLEKGSIIEGKITGYGSEGEGIFKIDGFPIFVPFTVVGDIVKVKITKSKKSFAHGALVEVVERSESRLDDDKICPYFKKCGGCSIANVKYENQLEFKREKVEETLKRIGNVKNVKVKKTIGMERPFFYRNKAQFPVEKIGDKIVVGFYQRKSHNVMALNECLICDEKINIVRKKVEEFFNVKKYSVFNEKTKKGLLRKLIVKTSYATNEIMVIVVINGREFSYEDEFVEMVKKIDGVGSVIVNKISKNSTCNMGLDNSIIYGKEYIVDVIDGVKFNISPLSFYQVNPQQTEKLYGKVLGFLNLNGTETIVDCYCGIGTISLLIAKQAKKVIGIEVVKEAIESAVDNGKINNFNNAEFFVGEVERLIDKILLKNKVDAIVVDPPRKGLDDVVVEAIIKSNVKKIVYVSCDCSTLARDLKKFCAENYVVEKVSAVDMFCHSSHVESVCLLSLK